MDHLPIRADVPEPSRRPGVPPAPEEHDATEAEVVAEDTEEKAEEESWPQGGFGSFP
jgi:ribosomal protein L12E/L44/L45/RPP1/RPP2